MLLHSSEWFGRKLHIEPHDHRWRGCCMVCKVRKVTMLHFSYLGFEAQAAIPITLHPQPWESSILYTHLLKHPTHHFRPTPRQQKDPFSKSRAMSLAYKNPTRPHLQRNMQGCRRRGRLNKQPRPHHAHLHEPADL